MMSYKNYLIHDDRFEELHTPGGVRGCGPSANLDPNRIYLIGQSDGGHMVSLVATLGEGNHYNSWRPHRSLGLALPNGRTSVATRTETQGIAVKRCDRLGGLSHEYERAACAN